MVSLGVHSLSLERETSTGVLANCSREFANFKRECVKFERELAELKRRFAEFKRFSRFQANYTRLINFPQEITGINFKF